MFYVYILQSSKDGKLYVGFTSDLRRRFKEHNAGASRSTKARRPFALVYYEAYVSEKDAKKREHSLKLFGKAREGIKRRIQNSLKR